MSSQALPVCSDDAVPVNKWEDTSQKSEAVLADVVKLWTRILQIKGATSPIIPSAPECLSSKESVYVLSNPFPSNPPIALSAQKPFYSQPNYSSWWMILHFGAYFKQFSQSPPRM